MITEAQARFALRRRGFRLSQRNSGYTILDADLNIASGIESDGSPKELTLQQVADWTAAEPSSEQGSDLAKAAEVGSCGTRRYTFSET